MKNSIKISKPVITSNRIKYNYEVSGDCREAFNLEEEFYIDYSCDISDIPEGIAIVPLLCNILPIAWIYDAEILIETCDKAFYDSIPEIKKGYISMYPRINFKGKISAQKLEVNNYSADNGKAAFFSGGVDAFNTLVCHADEKPLLLTIWGADVKLEDTAGWNNVLAHIKETSSEFNIDYVTIKSCFRRFINTGVLNNKVKELSGDNWWHGFQHGIGIIGHSAPICYSKNKTVVYLASSFTAADKGKVTCASDPTIDNYVKFGNTNIIHDGYEFNRQNKVHNITEYSNQTGKNISLRVCWQSTGGKNCCNCEKCWRTILALYAENSNPNEYGFDYSEHEFKVMTKKMKKCYVPQFSELRYRPIQEAMRKNVKYDSLPKELRWFYNINIQKLGRHPYIAAWDKCKNKAKRGIKKIIKSGK